MPLVLMYDYTLKPLAELVCRTRRSWVLNQPDEQLGAATLWLSVADPNLSEELLRFGNILYIHDGLLPDWAGVVGEPQAFDQAEVSIGATAAETLFDDRRLDGQTRLEGTPGAVYRQIVRAASLIAPLGIVEGDIGELGRPVALGVGTHSLLELIQNLQDKHGGEWGVEPSLSAGRTPVLSAWYRPQTGQDYSGSVALIEGVNITYADGPIMTRHGRVRNDVLVVGSGGKSDTGLRGSASDPASISAYGLRQEALVENLSSQSSVDSRAAQEVATSKDPVRRFEVTANNPDIYPYLRIGNTLGLELTSLGFEAGRRGLTTTVRVIGLATDDADGEVPLVLEEV